MNGMTTVCQLSPRPVGAASLSILSQNSASVQIEQQIKQRLYFNYLLF
jgi:hypothetical protein